MMSRGKREPIVYESEEAMRFGPRHYTGEQAEQIRQAVASRKLLIEPPIPIEGEDDE